MTILTGILLSTATMAIAMEESQLVSEANELLEVNEPEKAIAVLEQGMDEFAGSPAYDYLLGKAALASGKPNLAVFSLERAVLVIPSREDARFSLATAYKQLGENNQAKIHLNYILSNSSRKNYLLASQKLLDSLNSQTKPFHKLTLFAGFGEDSNANSAPENRTFIGVILSEESRAKHSAVSMFRLTDYFKLPVSRKIDLYSSTALFKYDFQNADFVNTLGGSFTSGIHAKLKRNINNNFSLSYRHIEVDEKLNNRAALASNNLQYRLNPSSLIGTSITTGRTDFAPKFSVKDFDFYYLGAYAYKQSKLFSKVPLTTRYQITSGSEEAVHKNTQYNRDVYSANIETSLPLKSFKNQMKVTTTFRYTTSQFDKPFFGINRNDENYSASIKLNIKLNQRWVIEPSINYVKNSSTVDLYDYDRAQSSIIISHQII